MIKKILFIAFATTCYSFCSCAQRVSGGVKGGLNVADQKFGGFAFNNADRKLPYHAGLFLSVRFSKTLGIQPELLVNNVGSKQNYTIPYSATPDNLVYRYTYLSLPIMFKWYPIKFINIHAGPQISYLLDANYTDINKNLASTTYVKSLEASASMGMELNLPFGLVATTRYNLGLTNTVRQNNNNEARIVNRYLQLSIGYKIFDRTK